jgi:alcohol dehydrogenase
MLFRLEMVLLQYSLNSVSWRKMMRALFTVQSLPHIVFGAGRLAELPRLVTGYGSRILVLLGAGSFSSTEEWGEVRQALTAHGIEFQVEHISGEPSPEVIDAITAEYRYKSLDCVVAIGGGSVLDSGKGVAAMLLEHGGVTSYLEGVGTRTVSGKTLPFIAVPTTSGTGSEMTNNAVISRVGEQGFKKSLRHENFIPDVALIDPELTLSCPPQLSTACAMDAFSQLVESYLSTKASPYTDDLALGAMQRAKTSMLVVCREDAGLDDRRNMAYAACISGIALTNAGLGVVHGMASVLGGRFPIPHGVVCGTLMGAANEQTLAKLRALDISGPALAKYTQLGKVFSARENQSDVYYQDGFIEMLHEMIETLPIGRLSHYGLISDDLKAVAGLCGSKNNPVELAPEEVEALLLSRL